MVYLRKRERKRTRSLNLTKDFLRLTRKLEDMESEKVLEEKGKPKERKNIEKSNLPDAEDVISEWFSQDHPDRLGRTCWRDHSQYREYHKTV